MSNTGALDTDKIASLLAAGAPQAAVAAAVGCDPSRISQLLSDTQFQELLATKGTARLQAAIDHDTSIESLEAKALRAVEQKLPFVRGPMEAAKIFQILNNSKKRAPANQTPDQHNVQIVQVILPAQARTSLRTNSQNQVIEVEGRTMATLPSKALPQRAAELLKTATPESSKFPEVPDLMTVLGGRDAAL